MMCFCRVSSNEQIYCVRIETELRLVKNRSEIAQRSVSDFVIVMIITMIMISYCRILFFVVFCSVINFCIEKSHMRMIANKGKMKMQDVFVFLFQQSSQFLYVSLSSAI